MEKTNIIQIVEKKVNIDCHHVFVFVLVNSDL
jgi:hypothetical protein